MTDDDREKDKLLRRLCISIPVTSNPEVDRAVAGYLAKLFGNNLTKCCGKEPTLRVSPEMGIFYECSTCGAYSTTEPDDDEAQRAWERLMKRISK